MIKKPLKIAKFLKMTCQSDTLDPHISPDTLINIVLQPLELHFSSLVNTTGKSEDRSPVHGFLSTLLIFK